MCMISPLPTIIFFLFKVSGCSFLFADIQFQMFIITTQTLVSHLIFNWMHDTLFLVLVTHFFFQCSDLRSILSLIHSSYNLIWGQCTVCCARNKTVEAVILTVWFGRLEAFDSRGICLGSYLNKGNRNHFVSVRKLKHSNAYKWLWEYSLVW